LGLNVHSASFEFVMGDGSSIDVSGTDNCLNLGLKLYSGVDSRLENYSFSLDEGKSKKFKFGFIGTDEEEINWDDLFDFSITATLDFDSPELTQYIEGTSTGFWICEGRFIKRLVGEGWEVKWQNPDPISFGDEGLFSVGLEDLSFDNTWRDGISANLDLFATITLEKAPLAHAPEPSTMILFGLGLLGFGVFAGKRFRKN
jgi:hypothetical protein